MSHQWKGFMPPQYFYSSRRFVGVALEPPEYEPGSWTGAGKVLYLPDTEEFLLTTRPRTARDDARGYAAEIHRSRDGVEYSLLSSVTKETAAEAAQMQIHSIEGTQLLKDPATGDYHFYLSVDTGDSFAWGGVKWETLLLTGKSLMGPWVSKGLVLRNDRPFDVQQARDSSIEIIDGRWICIYKARDGNRFERPALALSRDGIEWEKRGPLTVDGEDRVGFINGTMFPTASGIMMLGLETRLDDSREKKAGVVYADEYGIGHGGGPPARFVAYLLREERGDLETVFSTEWQPSSPYEHREHPLLGYSTTVFDPKRQRYLMYVEAIDPELSPAVGINSTVERLLVYEILV